jgi:hypothetical protein
MDGARPTIGIKLSIAKDDRILSVKIMATVRLQDVWFQGAKWAILIFLPAWISLNLINMDMVI